MELETDYPFVCRLDGGDLGVDDGWIDEKLTGKMLGEQVWTGDLRSIAHITGNKETLDCARQARVEVDFRLFGVPGA